MLSSMSPAMIPATSPEMPPAMSPAMLPAMPPSMPAAMPLEMAPGTHPYMAVMMYPSVAAMIHQRQLCYGMMRPLQQTSQNEDACLPMALPSTSAGDGWLQTQV